MFDDFLILLQTMTQKDKDNWINNINQFNRQNAILEAKKFIKFDLGKNKLILYKRNDDVDNFLELLGKLNQKDVKIFDVKGKKLDIKIGKE